MTVIASLRIAITEVFFRAQILRRVSIPVLLGLVSSSASQRRWRRAAHSARPRTHPAAGQRTRRAVQPARVRRQAREIRVAEGRRDLYHPRAFREGARAADIVGYDTASGKRTVLVSAAQLTPAAMQGKAPVRWRLTTTPGPTDQKKLLIFTNTKESVARKHARRLLGLR